MCSKKIYRKGGYGISTNTLIKVFSDFEVNYLPENKQEIVETLSEEELNALAKSKEFLDRMSDSKFLDYAVKLFEKSFKKLDPVDGKIIIHKIPASSALFQALKN